MFHRACRVAARCAINNSSTQNSGHILQNLSTEKMFTRYGLYSVSLTITNVTLRVYSTRIYWQDYTRGRTDN